MGRVQGKTTEIYEFNGIQDNGDDVVGKGDVILLQDSKGKGDRFQIGDKRANQLLKQLGASDVIGMSFETGKSSLWIRALIYRAEKRSTGDEPESMTINYGEIRSTEREAKQLHEAKGPDLRSWVQDRSSEIFRKSLDNALLKAGGLAASDPAKAKQWLQEAMDLIKAGRRGDYQVDWETYQSKVEQLQQKIPASLANL